MAHFDKQHLSVSERFQSLWMRVVNACFFPLRNRIQFRRGHYDQDLGTGGDALSDSVRAAMSGSRAAELIETYGLEVLVDKLEPVAWRSTLFICDLMDCLCGSQNVDLDGFEELSVLDVGAQNFQSAPGLFFGLSRFGGMDIGRQVILSGIELDAFRVYSTFQSRFDAAHYFIRLIEDFDNSAQSAHRFIDGDVMEHHEKYDLVTWFRPFLFEYTHLCWGLPRSRFSPQVMFEHVLGLVRPGGYCLIVNQEPEEDLLQIQMLSELGVSFQSMQWDSPFHLVEHPVYMHIVHFAEDS